jgi:hypothetical protein
MFGLRCSPIFALCLYMTGCSSASELTVQPAPQWFGTWETDFSRSNLPMDVLGPLPKSITRTIRDIGGGKVTESIVLTVGDGQVVEQPASTYQLDGTPTVIADEFAALLGADSTTLSFSDPYSGTLTFLKDGEAVSKAYIHPAMDGTLVTVVGEVLSKDGRWVSFIQVETRRGP